MSALAQQLASTSASSLVPTPCIGVCELDEESGLCRGCARNVEEIEVWQQADDIEKLAIWDAIAERRPALAMSAYRLSWSATDIAAMIERSLHRRWGRWVLGGPGASVQFAIGSEDDAEILSSPMQVTAVTSRGALRLLKHEKTIAVAFGDHGDGCGPVAIGLILPRGRVTLRRADCITCAGADEHAVCATHRQGTLFDLGLSPLVASRFCLRTADNRLADYLSSLNGSHREPDGATLAQHAAASKIHFVVESGLGRAETFAPNADDFSWPADDKMRELPDGWELRRVFAPCALFYPYSRRPAAAFVDGPF